MNSWTKGVLLAASGALLWGGSGVAAQYLFHNKLFTPEWLVVIRLLSSGLILLCIDAYHHFGDIFLIWKDSHDRKQLLIFGIIGMLSVQYTYFAAISCGNAATATVLQYLMPIVIIGYMVLHNHHLPSLHELTAVAFAMLGTLLLVTKGDFHTIAISPQALFWGILSAFCAAFYTIQPKYLLIHWRSPLVIGWAMLIGGIIMIPVSPPWAFTGIWDMSACLSLLFIIFFGTVFAFWSYLESIKYIKPTETSAIASLEPLSTVFLSIVLLHVSFGFIDMIGSLFIISTVFVLSKKNKTPSKKSNPAATK